MTETDFVDHTALTAYLQGSEYLLFFLPHHWVPSHYTSHQEYALFQLSSYGAIEWRLVEESQEIFALLHHIAFQESRKQCNHISELNVLTVA